MPKVQLPFLIGTWTEEAVAAYGDDWQSVSSYIRTQMAGLEECERTALEAEGEMTLKAGRGDGPAN